MVDHSERLRIQLSALTHSPQGDVDDTRFEKLLDRLTPYVTEESKLKVFLDNEGILSIEKGLSLEDERIVSIALRLVGFLASKLPNSPSSSSSSPSPSSSLLPNERVTKLMESLLDPQNININSDPLVRNACLIALSTSLSSLISVDWVTSHERINRLVSFIFRSFSDSSVFIARSATQLLCELVTKGPNVENRLLEAGLKRHIDTSMSEVPKSDFNTIVSPPPLHHNKICLIDLAIALHQHSHSSILDISLSSLLGLLSDSDRHVRSRMVEAIQIISANNNRMELENTNHSLAKLEKDIYDITKRLIVSGENDLILTAIELVGVLNFGISGVYLQKFLDLVIGIVVPAFEKVIPVRVEVANTFPVDIPQNILLQSVLECFKNMVSNGHTRILPGPLIVDLVKYGLTGPSQNQYAIYVRECRPAFELAALILSIFPSPSLPEPPSSLPWITQNEIQSILHTLLVSLARSWSSVSVKTVVSLLGNGKLESKIFVDFGFQLKESIFKGFASDESESREHVVAFIGTLYKADTTPTGVQYYLTSGFYQIVITALSDSDSTVRTAALESLKYISAEERTWREMVSLEPEVLVPLVSNFKPSESVADSNSSDLAEYKLLQLVVHLLYDEDPYVQRESIAVIKSWTTPEHTKLALQYLIWKSTSGLHEGINHALHRSDWDAQVQAIQLLRSIGFSLGLLSFFAIRGHALVLDMIKNCEERVSQKEAYKTLRDLIELIDQNNSDPSLLLTISLPLSVPVVGSAEYFKEELKELISQINTLEVDKMLQGLSDEHLYDEDEEEDLVLKYQDITSHDDLDCD